MDNELTELEDIICMECKSYGVCDRDTKCKVVKSEALAIKNAGYKRHKSVWVYDGGLDLMCYNCKGLAMEDVFSSVQRRTAYCPHCGAKME